MGSLDSLIAHLPQKPPFLFLDEVTEVDPGKSAVGSKVFGADDPIFIGHLPGDPIVPGVLIIEALAQLCGIAMLRDEPDFTIGFLADVGHLRFRRRVRPEERIELRAELTLTFGTTAKLDVSANVGGELVAEGVLTIGGMSSGKREG